MQFSITELRVHKTLQKKDRLDPAVVLGPAPDMITFASPILAEVKAELLEAEVLISGTVQADLRCACSRCLTEYMLPLKTTFRQSSVATEEPVDALPFIKEAVLLDLPLKTLCRESCQGLCPTCGVNRNEAPCTCESKKESPRWTALRNFPLS